MQTEAEVLPNHNELICSTNIEWIVTGRNAALQQIKAVIHQIDEISRLASSIGDNTAEHWAKNLEEGDLPAISEANILAPLSSFATISRTFLSVALSTCSKG